MADKNKILITSLIIVVVLLISFLIYLFLVVPSLNNYITEKQLEGYQYALASILQEAAKCQTFQVTYDNQTLNLFAVECLQQEQNSSA